MGSALHWKPRAATTAAASTGATTPVLSAPGAGSTHLDTALRLTAIALLLRPMGPWYVRPVLLALGVLVLVFTRALRHPSVWAAAALLTAVRIAEDWPLADNHIYLLCYWCLGIALALGRTDTPRLAAFTSRWLIGLAFAFALLWKAVLSPDFLDGRFFRVTLLTDPRFGAAAQLIGGLSAEQLDENRQALARMPHGAELLDPPTVHEPPRLRALATLATWGILALEAAVAFLMLAPTRGSPPGLRHATLLLFCVVTYAFAPVAGFGWLLLVMGMAQLDPGDVWWGRAYLMGFLLVLFYDEIPLVETVLDLVSRDPTEMSLQQIIMLAFAVSLLLMVFGFGLQASVDDVLYLIERPGLLVRATVAMFVIVPVAAVLLVKVFHLQPSVEAAMVALAISPLPPILPRKLRKAGSTSGFGLGLTVTMSVLSIVVAAVAVPALGWWSGRTLVAPLPSIVSTVVKFIVAPVVVGLLVRRFLPELANRLDKPVGIVATVLLALAALAVLAGSASAMWAVAGDGTLLALAVFVVVGLAAGHLMGSPEPEHQEVLAIASASRHPGIAIALASANFPMEHFGAVILVYLLVCAVVCAPYIKRQRLVVA